MNTKSHPQKAKAQLLAPPLPPAINIPQVLQPLQASAISSMEWGSELPAKLGVGQGSTEKSSVHGDRLGVTPSVMHTTRQVGTV